MVIHPIGKPSPIRPEMDKPSPNSGFIRGFAATLPLWPMVWAFFSFLEPVAYEEEAGDEKELKEASENWKLEIIKNLEPWHNF